MKLLGIIIVLLYTMIFAALGGVLMAFSFNLFAMQELTVFFEQLFQIENIHLIIGSIGLFLIISSICVAQVSFGKMQREKTIAFDNPNGQVSVSLSAIEDFIKRLSSSITEIRDLRSNVVAGKRGIEINTRVSLWADANIPETTDNIQAIIKNRIQEMLGIEEAIVVKVHVGKIVEKEKKKIKKDTDQEMEQTPSFKGNIEYGKD